MAELRVKLEGDDANLGTVAARDVARLILAVETAVMRAASVVAGRPKFATGRGESAFEQAARFRLVAIEEGSVVPVLELPEPQVHPDSLDLDVASLAESAVATLVTAAETCDGHPLLLNALVQLADTVHVGARHQSITLDYRSPRVGRRQKVKLDERRRTRLREAAERSEFRVRQDSLAGVLVEADFEKNTARLRGPFKEAVVVNFEDDLADEIQDALRRQATLQGKVVYDPETMTARTVTLTSISRGRQLVLGVDPEDFWVEHSFDDLALAHGSVTTLAEDLYASEATDDERDAFMAALADLDA